MFETYLAEDKYQVNDMTDRLARYMSENLDIKNCCLIYDQLVQINHFHNQNARTLIQARQ